MYQTHLDCLTKISYKLILFYFGKINPYSYKNGSMLPLLLKFRTKNITSCPHGKEFWNKMSPHARPKIHWNFDKDCEVKKGRQFTVDLKKKQWAYMHGNSLSFCFNLFFVMWPWGDISVTKTIRAYLTLLLNNKGGFDTSAIEKFNVLPP